MEKSVIPPSGRLYCAGKRWGFFKQGVWELECFGLGYQEAKHRQKLWSGILEWRSKLVLRLTVGAAQILPSRFAWNRVV